MASGGSGLDSELESFRKQWMSDLQSRKEPAPAASSSSSSVAAHRSTSPTTSRSSAQDHSWKQLQQGPPSPTLAKRQAILDDGSDYLQGRSFDEPAPPEQVGHVLSDTAPASGSKPKGKKKLVSALDHYEEAMEKESEGNMGDSLKLYRRAYRLDHGVDRRYREKHFPAASKAPAAPEPAQVSSSRTPTTTTTTSATTPTASQTAPPAASSETPAPAPVPPMRELLASFASLKIEPAVPDVEGEPPLPCPIAELPDELIVHILHDVAVQDVADFVRLSLVCKRLTYLVASEQRIWRRLCLGTEFGFPGMHYRWYTGIEWDALLSDSDDDYSDDDDDDFATDTDQEQQQQQAITSPRERQLQRRAALDETTLSLLAPSAHPSWKHMFRHRPRIRFNGCYISTVNYVRSGMLSTNQATWGGAPILIVTYYRYLRFFRDGSVISLLTGSEPSEVVHHLTPEALLQHRNAPSSWSTTTTATATATTTTQSHLPSAVMALAHSGRWRLSHPVPPGAAGGSTGANRLGGNAGAVSGDDDVSIETEGVGNKYVFKMELSLRSAGKATATRNNKLVWRSFFSYNKLTDDWAEFRLKNDKPFFFSRVRSYGLGME